MKNIIVSGYPKSGNTWATRLIAELVSCPVAGFWHREQYEIAREGVDRKSDFRCFKSHHQLHELGIDNISHEHFIIYVIRDPRDVAISGANYFEFVRFKLIADLFKKTSVGEWLYFKIINKFLCPEGFRISEMINAVLHGSKDVHGWCRVSWKTHYKAYMEGGYLFLRYEDLLIAPENECKRVLSYLGLDRSDSQIKAVIENQSFERKKERFLQNGKTREAKFLRVGKSEQWKRILSKKQKEKFKQLLREELTHFSYSVDDDT